MSELLPKKTLDRLRKERSSKRKRVEVFTSVRLSRATYEGVQYLARKMDRTQSWIMREAIESWVTYHMAKKEKPE